jgi:predicted phage tail protein
MVTIKLHGFLSEIFPSEIELEVRSVQDAIRALRANFDNFEQELTKDGREYHIVVNGSLDYGEEKLIQSPLGQAKSIDIIPVTKGSKESGIFQIILGVILIVAGLVTGNIYLVQAGVSLVIGGIALLLAPDLETEGYGDDSENSTFSGAANVSGQGFPVPVGYGRLIVGSHVISATLLSSEERAATAHVFKDTNNNNAITIVYKPKEGFWGIAPIFTMSQLWTDDDLGILDSTAEEEWVDGFSGSNYTLDLVYPDYFYLTYSFY